MTKARLIEDYIRKHPGATFHEMTVEFGYRPGGIVNRLEKAKRVHWRIDLKDGKTKHFYARKEAKPGKSKPSKKGGEKDG